MKTHTGMAIGLALMLTGNSQLLAQGAPQRGARPPQQLPATQQRPANETQDIGTLARAVNGILTADPIASAAAPPDAAAAPAKDQVSGDVPVKWESNHFVKGGPAPGRTDVLFTLSADPALFPSKNASVYLRVVTAEEASSFVASVAALKAATEKERAQVKLTTFSAEAITFMEMPADGKFSRAIQLKPGKYVAFIAIKEKAAQGAAADPASKLGILRHELVVPDFGVQELSTSSIILASALASFAAAPTAAQLESNPYIFGQLNVTPSRDGRYSKKSDVIAVFWIYGTGMGPGGKPDVTVDSQFFIKQGAGEKYFNRTSPQPLNEKTLPADFSLAQGHLLFSSVVVPLASFPVGDYRLEIKVTDKPTGKVVTQNIPFTVLPD